MQTDRRATQNWCHNGLPLTGRRPKPSQLAASELRQRYGVVPQKRTLQENLVMAHPHPCLEDVIQARKAAEPIARTINKLKG